MIKYNIVTELFISELWFCSIIKGYSPKYIASSKSAFLLTLLYRYLIKYMLTQSGMVGMIGLEPMTSRLSAERSNHLSYTPINGVTDGTWTHNSQDHNLGLYRLSYRHSTVPKTPILNGAGREIRTLMGVSPLASKASASNQFRHTRIWKLSR